MSCSLVLRNDTSPHTSYTDGPLQMQASRPGPVICPDFRTFMCDLRRAAKIPRNRSIIQKMRREAGARVPQVPGKYCSETEPCCPEPPARHHSSSSPYCCHFHSLGYHHHHPGPAPLEPGHHPMRQGYGSSDYRAPQYKVESVRLPAPLRRSSPRCCTEHRQLRSGIRKTIHLLLRACSRCYRSSDSVFPVNAMQLPLSLSLPPPPSCSRSVTG